MVHTCLQVLVQKGLQLLVLLVQEACLLNQVLALNQETVVLGEGLVKCSPYTKLLLIQDCCHLLPEDTFLSLNSFLLLLFCLKV